MFGGALTIDRLFGADRREPETAEGKARIQACTVTEWLYRQAQPIAQAYPGTTLADLRAMSLRDIANLLYWREVRTASDDERGGDPHEDLFGEMR